MSLNQECKKMQDMSVDEILKSIRKVIEKADNSNEKKEAASDDILELTDVVDISEDSEDEMEDMLLSEEAANETSSLFKNFAQKVSQVTKEGSKRPQTLEDFVVDMMRPQLKEWLDDNLPVLVKSLVEKEIRRLIPSADE